jgi:hypothetical protein
VPRMYVVQNRVRLKRVRVDVSVIPTPSRSVDTIGFGTVWPLDRRAGPRWVELQPKEIESIHSKAAISVPVPRPARTDVWGKAARRPAVGIGDQARVVSIYCFGLAVSYFSKALL